LERFRRKERSNLKEFYEEEKDYDPGIAD